MERELQGLLPNEFKEGLSYFEYTTFLAMLVYENCDYVVLEAGLGGEFDATNAFEKVLSVITPIGMDHEDFLGTSIKDIALTKLRSVSTKAIISKQKFEEVTEGARSLEKDSKITFVSYEDYLDDEMIQMAEKISAEQEHPHYLQENLLVSMAVVKELGYKVKINLFNSQRLDGRMQRIKPNVWLDVGHNSLAAEAISASFSPKSINLVYNSYKDKDYLSILSILSPIIKQVEIISVEDERIVKNEDLEAAIIKNGLKFKKFDKVLEEENYLVFGSFSVIEAFKKY